MTYYCPVFYVKIKRHVRKQESAKRDTQLLKSKVQIRSNIKNREVFHGMELTIQLRQQA